MAISRDKKSGNWEADKKSGGGVPTWARVLFPISNLASLRKGGKVRSKSRKSKSRMKARS
jgi:hypothetical protein